MFDSGAINVTGSMTEGQKCIDWLIDVGYICYCLSIIIRIGRQTRRRDV